MSPKEKIYFLRDELHHHNHLYYVKNEPVISDYEFDLKLGIYPVDNLSFGDKIPKGKRGGLVRQRTKKVRIF